MIRHDIIIAQTGTHEHLFDLRQSADFAQQADVVRVIDDHIRAGFGKQALPPRAGADLELLIAGGAAEIGRGAADVMDIALEIRHLRDGFRLVDDGFMAAGGDDASLQEGDGAEGAGAEAAARMRDGELHLFNGRNAAQRVVIGVPRALIRQGIRLIQFLAGERHIRHGLNDVLIAVALADGMAADRILLVILNEERLAVFFLAPDAVLVRRNFDAGAHGRRREEAHAAHLGTFPDGRAAAHPIRRDEDGAFAHAEHQQIRAGIHQNARPNGVIPVIVMREAAERSLHAADGDGNIAVGLANQAAIDIDRAIRPLGRLAAGGIHIGGTAALGGGIMVHHAVNHAGGDEKTIVGTAEALEIIRIFPIRLGEHRDVIARGLERADNDGRAEGRMIHICVAADVDKIRRVPAALAHIGNGCRREKKTIGHICKTP